MRSTDLDYALPPELIAQRPAERRDASRLLVYDRSSGDVRQRSFAELGQELAGYLTVVNDTRVVPARLALRRETGGAVELLLVERLGDERWEALARPSRRLRAGERLHGRHSASAVELVEPLGAGRWVVQLAGEPDGDLPLPPYVHETPADPERYQTVYARDPGSAAAPTAGLHFTPELLASLDHETVTLHVGLDTFRPLTTETVEEHAIHGERYRVEAAAWARIEAADRVLAVGTTTTRVLETLARGGPLEGRTDLFITPGFAFAARGRAPDELPPPADDAPRPGDGVRGHRRHAGAVRARDPRAVPVLLVRRRDARALKRSAAQRFPHGNGVLPPSEAESYDGPDTDDPGVAACPRRCGAPSRSGDSATTGIRTGSSPTGSRSFARR